MSGNLAQASEFRKQLSLALRTRVEPKTVRNAKDRCFRILMLGQDCLSSTASMAVQAIAFIQNVTSYTHCYVTSGISMTGKVSDFQGGKRGSYSDRRFKMKFLHAVLPVVILALASGTALARHRY